jgi:MFS family permease
MTIGVFLYSYIWFFVLTWAPSYLVLARKMSDIKMGVTLGAPLACMSVVSMLSGAMSDQIIKRTGATLAIRKLFVCSGFFAGSSLLLLLVPAGRETVLVVFLLSLCGIGMAGGNFWALAQMTAPSNVIGRVIGYLNTVA